MKSSILDTIKHQYIVDSKGKKTSVVLDIKTFMSIIEELEDFQDVIAAEKILEKGKSLEGRSIDEIERSWKKRD